MSNTNLQLTSREYKLMLNADRFQDRNQGSQIFLGLIEFLIKKEGGRIIEVQNKEERRQTSYLDTFELALYQNGFALRLREESKTDGGFQINLKYRAPDRYISASQDLSSPAGDQTKFEEDIMPPFISKFSHSTTVETNKTPDLSNMEKVASFFPGLRRLDIDGNVGVRTVNEFKAAEVVRKLCKFQFGEPPTIKACLSFWYLTDENTWPLVGEFSFDYDAIDSGTGRDRLETYPSAVVEGTNRFFRALQSQASWLDLNRTTKTAFALEGI